MAEKILIASGKGGVGKTSLTVGLGKALAAMGNRVLLIDCDCLRSIDLLVGVTEKDMKRLLDKYDTDFNYILIDAPAGIDRGLTLSAAGADRAIVISTPDLVCVRSACIAARKIGSLGIDDVRLIINRVARKDVVRGRLLNIDSVIDGVEVQLIGVVPEDAKIRFGAMGMNIYKENQISFDSLNNIAARITGEYVPLDL